METKVSPSPFASHSREGGALLGGRLEEEVLQKDGGAGHGQVEERPENRLSSHQPAPTDRGGPQVGGGASSHL